MATYSGPVVAPLTLAQYLNLTSRLSSIQLSSLLPTSFRGSKFSLLLESCVRLDYAISTSFFSPFMLYKSTIMLSCVALAGTIWQVFQLQQLSITSN